MVLLGPVLVWSSEVGNNDEPVDGLILVLVVDDPVDSDGTKELISDSNVEVEDFKLVETSSGSVEALLPSVTDSSDTVEVICSKLIIEVL